MIYRLSVTVLLCLLRCSLALVAPLRREPKLDTAWNPSCDRRTWIASTLAIGGMGTVTAADAVTDCFTDCFKNCKAIAPDNIGYCQEECKDYCDQPDRTDGLSGSVSSTSGEVGILGGTFGTGTVVKGKDKPPAVSLPGLDFTNTAGRKLIGY